MCYFFLEKPRIDPDVLQQVTVGIISNDVCKEKYKVMFGRKPIADHQLCAFYPGQDSCEVRNLICLNLYFIKRLNDY